MAEEKKSQKTKNTKTKKVTKSVKERKSSKKGKRIVPEGLAFIKASFNNTIITLTDPDGEVLVSCSPGEVGFKGTKKSTAFAATRAAESAVEKAQKFGLKEVKVYLSGPGQGRNAAVKGLDSAGLRITMLSDITPIPHNGCRPPRPPRK